MGAASDFKIENGYWCKKAHEKYEEHLRYQLI